jgi:hypothetical protein
MPPKDRCGCLLSREQPSRLEPARALDDGTWRVSFVQPIGELEGPNLVSRGRLLWAACGRDDNHGIAPGLQIWREPLPPCHPWPRGFANHGWRHRFKTIGMEAGIQNRIHAAIAQGLQTRGVITRRRLRAPPPVPLPVTSGGGTVAAAIGSDAPRALEMPRRGIVAYAQIAVIRRPPMERVGTVVTAIRCCGLTTMGMAFIRNCIMQTSSGGGKMSHQRILRRRWPGHGQREDGIAVTGRDGSLLSGPLMAVAASLLHLPISLAHERA